MAIDFDPRSRGISQPAQTTESQATGEAARTRSGDFFNTDPFAQQTVSEMDLLFSGTRNLGHLREEHPLEEIRIPGLDLDILGRAPVLGSSSRDLNEIIRRYGALRRNLIERRNNYSHALEGRLRPEEALDIYDRIEQIDRALAEATRQLDAAERKKTNLEALEERERVRQREAEETREAELQDLYRRSLPPGHPDLDES